ncbi:MAG: winged helix DNA-binding domain-containing protein [Pseudomonadaceae bacterium]|nr:winged helix DNA-binding domain-containing protein [Pseudomonadaceae bacterium]
MLTGAPFGRGLPACQKALEHIGYVQIDTISVIERAHHHVMYNRVPNYDPSMLNKLIQNRRAFEYWFHAAAYLPMRDYRFALPRMNAYSGKELRAHGNKKVLAQVRKRIDSEGPLMAREFDGNGHPSSGWWNWKPAKRALEQLFMAGELMVSERVGFQKRFDLRERVLPDDIDTSMPSAEEEAAHLLDVHLRSHALVSLKTITHLRRSKPLREAVKNLVDARLAGGDLTEVKIEGGETFVTEADLPDSRQPAAPKRVQLLSPFDNSTIHRHRLESLWQFDYLFECYVPKAKRVYGYFSLPVLYADEFIGMVDLKADRSKRGGVLNIVARHINPPTTPGQNKPNTAAIESALTQALNDFARFNGCARVGTQ